MKTLHQQTMLFNLLYAKLANWTANFYTE